jgi:hypothetical protein
MMIRNTLLSLTFDSNFLDSLGHAQISIDGLLRTRIVNILSYSSKLISNGHSAGSKG